ncbi:complement factor H-related protein 4 [Lates calcarifer]|uniref:Complement factor H-related protein 4 n=1 Tax=Lates calcarifer TaxID=8187 RepID=A0AAJ7LN42_LATCA|nr:complement factor H-related protein 4 [Lates calcarifer]
MRFPPLLCLFVLWLDMDVSFSQNEPAGCQTPPALTDGDIKDTMKQHYSHSERVEYMCQNYYTMEGDPYRTCINGEWTGQIRCLKPCTVNENDMIQRNIAFRYRVYSKLYAPHNDVIEFRCTRGRPVGAMPMRFKCNDGVMILPTCQ